MSFYRQFGVAKANGAFSQLIAMNMTKSPCRALKIPVQGELFSRNLTTNAVTSG
jgi:hypothetical protein